MTLVLPQPDEKAGLGLVSRKNAYSTVPFDPPPVHEKVALARDTPIAPLAGEGLPGTNNEGKKLATRFRDEPAEKEYIGAKLMTTPLSDQFTKL